MSLECNIEKSDRTNRMVIGVILVVGAVLGFGRFWAILVGLVLIAEGYIGWCGIPIIMSKFKKSDNTQPPVA